MKLKFILLLLTINVTPIFAQQTVGLFYNDSTSFNGYTLITPLNSNQSYLIDNCGFIINEWSNSQYAPGAATYLLEDGTLIKTSNTRDTIMAAGGSGGVIEKYDWDDNLIWSYTILDSTERQHHDIEVLPNGNILVLAFDYKTANQALTAGRDPNLLDGSVWSEKIIELQPIGLDSAVIVWEWYLWDHLIQNYDANANNFGVVKNYPELVDFNYYGFNGNHPDWIHANSISYNHDLDQIMISARNYNELWIIDHSTTTTEAAGHTGGNSGKGGDLLYRWGNSETYDIGDSTDRKLDGQHNPYWIPNGYKDGGKILVYNNQFENPSMVSTIEIIEPPVDINGNYFYQTDSAYLPKNSSWIHQSSVYSSIVSNAQRLPNGNTLICNGRSGTIIEIDTNNQEVWQYINPAGAQGTINTQGSTPMGNMIFRAYRYAPEYPAFDGRDMTPGNPIELNPLPSTCQLYFPTTTISQNWGILDLKVMGNPISDELRIENYDNNDLQLVIVDLSGKVILEDKTNKSIISYDASNWTKGNYFIIAIDEVNQKLFRQQIIKL